MAYSRVTRTRFGAAALQYVLQDSGHNGAENRNEIVTAINMCSSIPYHQQMAKYWIRARANHKTQIIRVIQSFSKKELDPENPADIIKANVIGQEFAGKYYPGRQVLVCTQIDGEGGCIHNHILVNDVSMTDNKGCCKEQYFFPKIKEWTNETAKNYITLDTGEKKDEVYTPAEKRRLKDGEYCYAQDIKERVKKAMEEAVSEDDFKKRLADNGVSVDKKPSKTYGEYFLFELVDLSNVPEEIKKKRNNFKKRSYKMGENYSPEAVDAFIVTNKANKFSSDDLQSNTKKDYSDVVKAFAADKGNAENLNLPETKDKIEIIPQNASIAENGENDYEPGRRKTGASASKSEETKTAVSPAIYETPNENTKLNFNIPPINLNDILNYEEDEDKKENLHTVRKTVEPEYVIPDNTATDSIKSVEISKKSTEQYTSKKSGIEQVSKEVSNEPVKAKKTHTRKPIFGNKASKNKPNTNNWALSRLYKAMGLPSNIQTEQEDDELSR